jgi:hypothetical protein
MTRGETAQEAVAMKMAEVQQDPHEAPIEQSMTEDAHARLIAATELADTLPNAAKTFIRGERQQLLVLKDALQLLVERLRLPGQSMSEEALTETIVADLTGTTFIEARRLVARALDELTDEGLLARIETLVVLRPDAPPTGRRYGKPTYEGITPDDVRAELNQQLLEAGPGFSMDRSVAFARVNHAINCGECVHHSAQLKALGAIFDLAINNLIKDGFLAQIVSYVRLPDAGDFEVGATDLTSAISEERGMS